MTGRRSTPSLLDLAGGYLIDAWVVFRNTPERPRWHLRGLRDGFRHCDVWVRDRGVWVCMEPYFEFPALRAHTADPWDVVDKALKPTFVRAQRVVRLGSLTTPWLLGPLTCVEAVKLALGVRAFWVRTPHQLYQYLRKGKRDGR